MSGLQEVYFGAGCFWNAEKIYSTQQGVVETEVGWVNIPLSNSNKNSESRVEVVKIIYSESETNLDELVQVFWTTHNPKHEKNQDESYVERSVLIYKSRNQQKELTDLLNQKKQVDQDILTDVVKFLSYRKAPEKDQKYYMKN